MSSLIQEKKPEDILPILETFFDSKRKIIEREIEKEISLAKLEIGYMLLIPDNEKVKIESAVEESKKILWEKALEKANGNKKKAISFFCQTYGKI